MLPSTRYCLLEFAQPYPDRSLASNVFGQQRSYRLFLSGGYDRGQPRYPAVACTANPSRKLFAGERDAAGHWSDAGCLIDDTVQNSGALETRHGLPTAQKLLPSETTALAQRRRQSWFYTRQTSCCFPATIASPWLMLLLALLTAPVLCAQSVDLSGSWRAHSGDDARYASPAYDDSGWGVVQLPRTSEIPFGVTWFRRTVTSTGQGEALAIGLVSHCYEVFVNGERMGDAGCTPEQTPFFRPRAFPIPQHLRIPGQPTVIALRTERRPVAAWGQGGRMTDTGPYLLGTASHAESAVQAAQQSLRLAVTPLLVITCIQGGIGVLLLVLWSSNRNRMELLWYALFLFGVSLNNGLLVRMTYLPVAYGVPVFQLPVTFLFLNAAAYQVLAGRPIPLVTLAVTAITTITARLVVGTLYLLPATTVPIWLSLRSLRHGNFEQRAFAIATLCYSAVLLNAAAGNYLSIWTGSFQMVSVGPFVVYTSALVSTLFSAAGLLVLMRIVGNDRRQRDHLQRELEAARAVQQLLLQPAADSAEYSTEAVYLAAEEVGGDFYQIVDFPDGSRVALLGDVSGKGLKAAMLVSVALGAIRRDGSSSPAAILTNLNDALAGRAGGGFATCCAVRVEPGGKVTIASAGHPAPYKQGVELAVEAGLPLGVLTPSAYDETACELEPGQQVTICSDGVFEAANRAGELYGFERTRAIAGKAAPEIAAAAQTWGQNDDITVVTIRRRPK